MHARSKVLANRAQQRGKRGSPHTGAAATQTPRLETVSIYVLLYGCALENKQKQYIIRKKSMYKASKELLLLLRKPPTANSVCPSLCTLFSILMHGWVLLERNLRGLPSALVGIRVFHSTHNGDGIPKR